MTSSVARPQRTVPTHAKPRKREAAKAAPLGHALSSSPLRGFASSRWVGAEREPCPVYGPGSLNTIITATATTSRMATDAFAIHATLRLP